jgi:hypothetical protein
MRGQMQILNDAQIAQRELDQKTQCTFSTPRAPFHRVENSARVMVFDSLAQVVRQAGIETFWDYFALKNVNVKKIWHNAWACRVVARCTGVAR